MADYDDSKDKRHSQARSSSRGGSAQNQRRTGNQFKRTSAGMLPPQKTAPPPVVMRKADGTAAAPLPFTGISDDSAAWAFHPHLPAVAPQAPVQARGEMGAPSVHKAAADIAADRILTGQSAADFSAAGPTASVQTERVSEPARQVAQSGSKATPKPVQRIAGSGPDAAHAASNASARAASSPVQRQSDDTESSRDHAVSESNDPALAEPASPVEPAAASPAPLAAQTEGNDDSSWLDWVQGGLDVASIALDATGVGAAVSWVPDVVNAGISAGRGDWAGASLSMAASIPMIGAAANTARVARTVAKSGDEIAAGTKAVAGSTKTPHTISGSRPPGRGNNGTPNSIYEQRRADGSTSVTYYDEKGRRFAREDYGQKSPHGELPQASDGRTAPHEHRYDYSEKGPTGKRYRELDKNGKPAGPWRQD